MAFNDFRFRVALRVILIGLVMALIVFMLSRPNMIFAAILAIFILLIQLVELYRFTSQTNRKLSRFLESVRYSDFISGFTTDNKLGRSFRELNAAFNEVLEAFRKARSEKEEHWQYLNTIVQQVRTGILSYDANGEVQLINANARKFMGVSAVKNISELRESNPRMYQSLRAVEAGNSTLYKGGADLLVTIQASELRMRGQIIKVVTMQNIQSEMQRQELEAWQNLTRVLRHEIMNSITPISSLTSTLREILDHDLVKANGKYVLKDDGAEDLRDGLNTIENRSKGLIKFIDAYREYTSLPPPKVKTVLIKNLIEGVVNLMQNDVKLTGVRLECDYESEYLTIQADEEMIEQVLINLVKNAIEACSGKPDRRVTILGKYSQDAVIIEVVDNGPGIIKEALDGIFVPFFTTKKEGSGIGLSLSRQIMQMHNGSLSAESEPDVRTVFRLQF